jgi:hypothetical protein
MSEAVFDHPFSEVVVLEWDELIHTDEVLNANHVYRHWSHKAERIRAVKDKGIVRSATLPKFKAARLDVTVSYPIAWKADVNNWQPTMKHYVDGLVNVHPKTKIGQGILPDDNDRHFSGPHMLPSGKKSGMKGWFIFHCKLTGITE